MAQMTASAFLLQRLLDWGVRRIYGYPGDGINGLIGALEEFKDRIDFTQVRHEEISNGAFTTVSSPGPPSFHPTTIATWNLAHAAVDRRVAGDAAKYAFVRRHSKTLVGTKA